MERRKPDPGKFPRVDDELLEAMRRETVLFTRAVLREDLSVLDFFGGRFSFMNGPLARHYLIGRAIFVYWPPTLWGLVPHYTYASPPAGATAGPLVSPTATQPAYPAYPACLAHSAYTPYPAYLPDLPYPPCLADESDPARYLLRYPAL